MSRIVAIESRTTTVTQMVAIAMDPNSIPFVAKLQKAKTRKNKNYYVLRATIPKEVSEKIGAKAGDYLFFKAKKAEWYHMLDWNEMSRTWQMLPDEVRNKVFLDGLYGQGIPCEPSMLSATNAAAVPQQLLTPIQQSQMVE